MGLTHILGVMLGLGIGDGTQAQAAQVTPDTLPSARPRQLQEVVTTAARVSQAVAESPHLVRVLDAATLTRTAGGNTPEVLRRIPGFSTRDQQAAFALSPVRSVVSFRGMAGSSAGRTLVLLDGLPLGEGFTGWLYWSRVPLALVQRVEVVSGGGSMTWGNRALGGVINLSTEGHGEPRAAFRAEAGSGQSRRMSLSGATSPGRLRVMAGADWASTDGFVVVAPAMAGPIDVPVGERSKFAHATATFDASPSWQFSLGANYLDVLNPGPTPLGAAEASIGEVRVSTRWLSAGGSLLQLRAARSTTNHLNPSTSISNDRTTESPREELQLESTATMFGGQWSRMIGGHHHVGAGVDLTLASGDLRELTGYSSGSYTVERRSEGTQWLGGVYVQDHIRLGEQWRLEAAARLDRIVNQDGRRVDRRLATGATVLDSAYARSSEGRVNGKLGLRFDASSTVSLRGSVYRAFRAPTGYELYYSRYSSRGTVTAANPALRAERLNGVELGLDLSPAPTLLLRLNGFYNQVSEAILDYTVGTATVAGQVFDACGAVPKGQTCRQRRNVAGLRTLGIEAEARWQPSPAWDLVAGYTFNPATVIAPGQPVDGLVAIRAPRHAASASVAHQHPRFGAFTVEQRIVGARMEDDLNTIALASFAVTSLRLGSPPWRGRELYLKVDNVFNARYEVTRSANGYAEIGQPRWVTVGLRAAW